MTRNIFKQRKETNNFLHFCLFVMVLAVSTIVLEHVEAEQPQTSGAPRNHFSAEGRSSTIIQLMRMTIPS